jgi:hypothetical protein
MSAYEGFLRMLRAANISFEYEPNDQGTTVLICATKGERNVGYSGLYTSFTFNEDGELDSVGSWSKPPSGVVKRVA